MIALAAAGAGFYLAPLAADPVGAKDCGSTLPPLAATNPRPAATAEPNWAQRGGTINRRQLPVADGIAGIVAVRSEADVADALAYARARGLTVSAAGVKHQMGGQAFRRGRRGARHARPERDPRSTRTGALSRSAPARPGTRSRTPSTRASRSRRCSRPTSSRVGGSISVNAHGMDHRAGALIGSIRSLRVMLADGQVVDRLARRECRSVPPCRRRLRPVRDRALGRARRRPQRHLPLRAGADRLSRLPRAVRRRSPRDPAVGLMLRPSVDRAGLAARRGVGLSPTTGSRTTRAGAGAARRGRVDQVAAPDGQPRQARRLSSIGEMVGGKASRAPASRAAP